MTDKHEHINAAIRAAEVAVWGNSPEVLHPWKREMARALIADLLRDMDEPPLDPPAMTGWDLAIQVIERRAGLEGEG